MKRLSLRAFGLAVMIAAAAGGLTSFALPLLAEDRPPVIIAVLDVPKILKDSKAAKAIRGQIEKQQAAYQADIAKQENALRATDQQLASQRDSLPQDQYAQKRDALEKQVADLRKSVQNRKQQLETAYEGGMDQVRNALIQIVAEIAQARGYTLVLNKSDVVLSVNDFDITAETIKKLDAKLPSVTLPKAK